MSTAREVRAVSSCIRCGKQASNDAYFCTWCGVRLPDPAEESWLLDPDGPAWSPEPARRTATPRKYPRRRSRIGLLAGVTLLGVLCGAGAAVLLARTPHHAVQGRYKIAAGVRPASGSASPSRSPFPSPSSTAIRSLSPSPSRSPVPAEEKAARGLSTLLAQSNDDRSAVVDAAGDVRQCGPDLAQDARIFTSTVASRQRLLTRLAALPDASSLPAVMVQALTSAWQASVQADLDYAAWAQDQSSGQCTPGDADANLSAATAPADQANADKETFLNLWNPIATQYGLPTYQSSQL
jgi:hypothetical protein